MEASAILWSFSWGFSSLQWANMLDPSLLTQGTSRALGASHPALHPALGSPGRSSHASGPGGHWQSHDYEKSSSHGSFLCVFSFYKRRHATSHDDTSVTWQPHSPGRAPVWVLQLPLPRWDKERALEGQGQAARCMGAGPATCRSPHRSAEASELLAGHVVPRALPLRSPWPFSCSSMGTDSPSSGSEPSSPNTGHSSALKQTWHFMM